MTTPNCAAASRVLAVGLLASGQRVRAGDRVLTEAWQVNTVAPELVLCCAKSGKPLCGPGAELASASGAGGTRIHAGRIVAGGRTGGTSALACARRWRGRASDGCAGGREAVQHPAPRARKGAGGARYQAEKDADRVDVAASEGGIGVNLMGPARWPQIEETVASQKVATATSKHAFGPRNSSTKSNALGGHIFRDRARPGRPRGSSEGATMPQGRPILEHASVRL